MTSDASFPPATPPSDKAKYRQFLIDHELDPNLDTDDLRREVEKKSEAERSQLQSHWNAFLSAL